MKFIVDTQLPPKLALFFDWKGYDCTHTTDYHQGHLLADLEIVEIAKQEARTIITKDSDFLDHYMLKGSPPGVLLIACGNTSNKELMHLLGTHLTDIIQMFKEGAGLVVFKKDEIIGY